MGWGSDEGGSAGVCKGKRVRARRTRRGSYMRRTWGVDEMRAVVLACVRERRVRARRTRQPCDTHTSAHVCRYVAQNTWTDVGRGPFQNLKFSLDSCVHRRPEPCVSWRLGKGDKHHLHNPFERRCSSQLHAAVCEKPILHDTRWFTWALGRCSGGPVN